MVKTTRKKSYHGYEARLETFSGARLKGSKPRSRKVTWPHARPSATQVAKAGFYFTPSPLEFGADLVTCYMCGCGIDGWEPEDDPLKVHIENCKNCPLAILQSKPWETDPHHDPRCDESLSTRLQTYYQPLTNEELEAAIINSAPETDGNPSPSKATQLSSTSLMLMGTSVWPHDSKKGWLPTSESMAKAGFYYFPNFVGEDFGLCPYCGLGLDGWEPTDEPVKEHQRRSPKCLYFTCRSFVPLELERTAERSHNTQSQTVQEFSDNEDGYETASSVASATSKKRKKASNTTSTTRKRVSKMKRSSRANSVSSTHSGLSESDASTSGVVAPIKRKRGRPSRKVTAPVDAQDVEMDTMSEINSQLSANNDQLKSDSLIAKDNIEHSASVLRGVNAPLSKGSVFAKISKFEGIASAAAKPSEAPQRKAEKTLFKSNSLSKIKSEKVDSPCASEVNRSKSVQETKKNRPLPKSSRGDVIEEERPLSKLSSKIKIKKEELTPFKIKTEPIESPSFRSRHNVRHSGYSSADADAHADMEQGTEAYAEDEAEDESEAAPEVENKIPTQVKVQVEVEVEVELKLQPEINCHRTRSVTPRKQTPISSHSPDEQDQPSQSSESIIPECTDTLQDTEEELNQKPISSEHEVQKAGLSGTLKTSWPRNSLQFNPASPPPVIYQDCEDQDDLLAPPRVPPAATENWATFSGTSSAASSRSSTPEPRMPRNQKAELNLAKIAQAPVSSPAPVTTTTLSSANPALTSTSSKISYPPLSLAPPKLPLTATSVSARNTTPPPAVLYGDNESRPSLTTLKHTSKQMSPALSYTPARQISPQQPSSPPNPHHHSHHHNSKWAPVDPDMVFDLLETSASSSTDASSEPVLDNKHLDKTVLEWIEHLATESELRLKANCDALIAMLETESKRAVAALEALPVRT